MTDEEIHNIYLHMSGKAEGLVETTGKADFPVMFARAILEYNKQKRTWVGLTKMELVKCGVFPWGNSYQLYQAIESKLKEKNGY